MNTMRPAYDLKPGDLIGTREVFDVRDTFGRGGRVAILFVDGDRKLIDCWDTLVPVKN